MQSAPNQESLLAFLNNNGHNYTNEKALIEACKDNKTFLNISKDLLEKLQFGHIRSWMATEVYSFSHDVERTRLALPLVNDFLALMYMFEHLNIDITLQMFLVKPPGEKWVTFLGKAVNFLQARGKVLKDSQSSRIEYQLMLKTLKNVTEKHSLLQKQFQQLSVEKQKQRPVFEVKIKQFNQLIASKKELEGEKKSIADSFDEIQKEWRMIQAREMQFNRSAEQTEIKISQFKRELIRFAPDIKKENEHVDFLINEKKDKINFIENGFQQFSELYFSVQRKLIEAREFHQSLKMSMAETEELGCQQEKKFKQIQDQINIKGPKLTETEKEINLLEKQLKELEGTTHRNDMLKQEERKKTENIESLTNECVNMDETIEKGLRESGMCKGSLESSMQNELLRVGQLYQQLEQIYQEKKQFLSYWHQSFEDIIKRKTGIFKTDEDI